MKNKKWLIITICSILIIVLAILGCIFINHNNNIKKAKDSIILNDLEVEFLESVKVSDFIKSIDGKIEDDFLIDTTKLGEQEIEFSFKNEIGTIKSTFTINVLDKEAPLIWLNNSYNVTKGSEDNLIRKILCGDNYDSKPVCEIIGDYNLNKTGAYKLTFKATDSSGNTSSKEFVLNVKEPTKPSKKPQSTPKVSTAFSDVVKNYKSDKTQIGIDVSKWQGDIDFNKLKEAGVEFVFIRVGSSSGKDGDYFVDSKFLQNIKNANAAGIPTGIYYYSYASTKERAMADAKWVIEQIKDYKVDLPVAFDWENWGSFNDYNLSFYGLTEMAKSFMQTLEESGYEGMLYSSKTYLENMWYKTPYQTWLAHYTKKTNYKDDYAFWQMCNNGKVDGINGDVDIDIRYLK